MGPTFRMTTIMMLAREEVRLETGRRTMCDGTLPSHVSAGQLPVIYSSRDESETQHKSGVNNDVAIRSVPRCLVGRHSRSDIVVDRESCALN